MPVAEGLRFRAMQQTTGSLSKSASVSTPGPDATAIPISIPIPMSMSMSIRGRAAFPRRGTAVVALATLALFLASSAPSVHGAEPQVSGSGVIGFELGDLDAEGLIGPPDGKRAVDYEFCIPAGAAFIDEVRGIDPSARFMAGSRGRIGCGPEEVLVLGNTYRSDFAVVLQRLVELPYVERIEQAWYE